MGLRCRFGMRMTWVVNVLEKVPCRHPGAEMKPVVFTVQRRPVSSLLRTIIFEQTALLPNAKYRSGTNLHPDSITAFRPNSPTEDNASLPGLLVSHHTLS